MPAISQIKQSASIWSNKQVFRSNAPGICMKALGICSPSPGHLDESKQQLSENIKALIFLISVYTFAPILSDSRFYYSP